MDKKQHRSAVFVLIIMVMAALACSLGGGAPRSGAPREPEPTGRLAVTVDAAAPTASNTSGASPEPIDATSIPSRPTSPPLPATVSPTAASAAPEPSAESLPLSTIGPEVFEELYFVGGGGGAACVPLANTGDDVALVPSANAPGDSSVVCLRFSPTDVMTVALYSLEGDILGSGTFAIDGELVYQVGPGNTREEVGSVAGDFIGIDVVWPLAVMPDEGYIRAVSASRSVQGRFPSHAGPQPPVPRLSVIPDTWKLGDDPFVLLGYYTFAPGDDVIIAGAHFEPDSHFPIAVYHGQPEYGEMWVCQPCQLVVSAIATTDGEGSFTMLLEIEVNDPAGLYYVVAFLQALEDIPGCEAYAERPNWTYCPLGPDAGFYVR